MSRAKRDRASRRSGASGAARFEAELLRGLKPFASAELERLGGVRLIRGDDPEALAFDYHGDWRRLQGLRMVVAVYALRHFEVPRPKALLGHQHLQSLLGFMHEVLAYDPNQRFEGFRFSAAGSDSAVFKRLASELRAAGGLAFDPERGELLLRFRPAAGGWEVLARLTPRPLSVRAWRVCNMPGGLNATVAAAMLELAGHHEEDRVLNAMCGSGTLLLERRSRGPDRRLLGVDNDPGALDCARQNVAAGGYAADIELREGDATDLPFPEGSFDLIAADLPWGDAVGSMAANAALYPAFLQEAARLAAPGARLVVLSHAIKQFEGIVRKQSEWAVQDSVQVYHGGHYPKMYLLGIKIR